jgi:hypothetical protein
MSLPDWALVYGPVCAGSAIVRSPHYPAHRKLTRAGLDTRDSLPPRPPRLPPPRHIRSVAQLAQRRVARICRCPGPPKRARARVACQVRQVCEDCPESHQYRRPRCAAGEPCSLSLVLRLMRGQVVYAHGNGTLKPEFYDAFVSIKRGLFNTRDRAEHTRALFPPDPDPT